MAKGKSRQKPFRWSDHWMHIQSTSQDIYRARNKHWKVSCDRFGYPTWIAVKNKHYKAEDTKHGKEEECPIETSTTPSEADVIASTMLSLS